MDETVKTKIPNFLDERALEQMPMAHGFLQETSDSMPEGFPFYRLGHVKLDRLAKSGVEPDFSDLHILAFPFHGDLRGTFFCFVEKGLEVGIYMEMGNVIGGRTLSALGRKLGLEVMLRPPKQLARDQFERFYHTEHSHEIKTYLHFYKFSVITVHTLVLFELKIAQKLEKI